VLTNQLEDELRGLLRGHALFSRLSDDALGLVLRRGEVVVRKVGQTVLAEGEPGDAAYLVCSGRVRVVKDGPDGRPVTLATLGPGELLGEHALLTDAPRTASARAADDAVLFRLGRGDFLALLREQPELRQWFEKLIAHRGLARFLQTATFLSALPARQVAGLVDQLEVCRFAEGETILREGDRGGRMYVLTAGEAKVVKGPDDAVLAYLVPGDYFGERALLTDEPRYAGVVALSPAECACLDRVGLDRLLEGAPQVRERLRRHCEEYAAREEAARRFGVRAPRREEAPAVAWEAIDDDAEPARPRARPRRHWFGPKRAYPFVAQEDETDCGAASLAMVARYHNVRLSVERLRELAHVGGEGASGLALMRAAEAVGFDCRPVKTDFGHLCGLPLPAVAHWRGCHYLVVYEAGEGRVVLGDPAAGVAAMGRAEFERGWTGGLFLLTPTPRLGEVVPSRSAWGLLRVLVAPFRMQVAALAGLSLLLAAVVVALPLLLTAQAVPPPTMWTHGPPLLGAAALALLQLRRELLLRLGGHVGRTLEGAFLRRLLHLPPRTVRSRPPGALLLRLGRAQSAGRPVLDHLAAAFLALVVIGLGVGLTAFRSVPAAGATLLYLALLACILRRLGARVRANDRQIDLQEVSLRNHWPEVLAPEALKQATREGELLARQRACRDERDRLAGRSQREQDLTFTLAVGAALLLMTAALALLPPGAAALLGVIALASLCLVRLWPSLVGELLALQQLADLLDLPLELSPQQAKQTPHLRGAVRLEGVSFRHRPEGRDVLAHVSLEAEPGQVLWVVGRAGSGKTTLARLLLALERPTAGAVRIDGHDVSLLDPRHLRRHVHVVPEEPALVAGTVHDNIALAAAGATREQVISAARLVGLHDLIMGFPLAYDTLLGAPGVRLSLAQRQCVCLARAALADPRVLVLDDATALLDAEDERALLEGVRRFAAGRTLLILSRRAPHARPGDCILVLQDGQPATPGRRDRLPASPAGDNAAAFLDHLPARPARLGKG
jgi:ATP-binding cassette subfamily B protein